ARASVRPEELREGGCGPRSSGAAPVRGADRSGRARGIPALQPWTEGGRRWTRHLEMVAFPTVPFPGPVRDLRYRPSGPATRLTPSRNVTSVLRVRARARISSRVQAGLYAHSRSSSAIAALVSPCRSRNPARARPIPVLAG